MMELKDTIKLMNSDDYKERFKAEYYQTKIRYDKLREMLIKCHDNVPELKSRTLEALDTQMYYMGKYLNCLEMRAEIEKIEL